MIVVPGAGQRLWPVQRRYVIPRGTVSYSVVRWKEKHWFHNMKLYIEALRESAGGLWEGQGHSDEGPKPRDGTRGTPRGELGRPDVRQGEAKGRQEHPTDRQETHARH